MAITFRELLDTRCFKDFKVIAGNYGLDKKVGLVLTCEEYLSDKNSYVFLIHMVYHKTELSFEFVKSIIERGYSGLGVQLDNGQTTLNQDVINICEGKGFPLIEIPADIQYMEIVRNVDSICVDSKVQNIYEIINIKDGYNHDMKISKTIGSLANDLNREVKIYDLLFGKIFLSDGQIIKNADMSKYEHIWNPKSDFQKKSIAEKFHMFILIDNNLPDSKELIILPVSLSDEELAYMTIDGRDLEKDYHALYTIKISFLFIVSEYKSAHSEVVEENKTRDRIMQDMVNGILEVDNPLFIKYFGKHKMRPFTAVALRQFTADLNMFMRRERAERCIYNHLGRKDAFLGILDFNEMVLLIAQDRAGNGSLKEILEDIIADLEDDMGRAEFKAGLVEEYTGIEKLAPVYTESLKCLEIGSVIMKNAHVFSENDIGPFLYFDLERAKGEAGCMYEQSISSLLEEGDGRELILTLKEYLNCNLNVSEAAKKMYLHSNTIRYRINKIEELLDISLKDSFTRLKIEIILMFFHI